MQHVCLVNGECTGRPPLVYGFNGIPFTVLIWTLYGELLKWSPCTRGHTYMDRRALTIFLYGEKTNHDSSDSNERESVRPQPKREDGVKQYSVATVIV